MEAQIVPLWGCKAFRVSSTILHYAALLLHLLHENQFSFAFEMSHPQYSLGLRAIYLDSCQNLTGTATFERAAAILAIFCVHLLWLPNQVATQCNLSTAGCSSNAPRCWGRRARFHDT